MRHIFEGFIFTVSIFLVIVTFIYLLPVLMFSFMWVGNHGLDLAIKLFGDIR